MNQNFADKMSASTSLQKSAINFAIDSVGVPVGRVDIMYLYPMSWLEFLYALGRQDLYGAILNHDINVAESPIVHQHIMSLLQEYLAIGGMPEVVKCWITTKDPNSCAKLQHSIINSYRQDFHKYAKQSQIKYVEIVFDEAIKQLGTKFKFSSLRSEYRKRELSPALDLLEKACVIHRVCHSDGQGVPLGAQIHDDKFKIIFLDIGLSQALLGLDFSDWFLNGATHLNNNGAIAEAFVGQELLAYSNPYQNYELFYWLREAEARNSTAEVDYLIQYKGKVVPIEVKSGKGNNLTSMKLFLESHLKSKFGIRYSTNNYSIHENIHSYPLYAVPLSIGWQYIDFPSAKEFRPD